MSRKDLMHCPFCKISLTAFQEADLHLDYCPAGHGIWFDGDELAAYRKNHPEVGTWKKGETEQFLALPGLPVKECPRCNSDVLQGGRLHELDVWHCFTCHGVFLGQPIPMAKDPLDPTPVLVGTMILDNILIGF